MLATSRSGERSRRWLQERIWGSRERANSQASLRRELSNLRSLVNSGGHPLLIIGYETVALDLTQILVDVRDPARVAESRDEFLEGIDIAWEEGFEDWLREERQAIDSAREAAGDLFVGDRPSAQSDDDGQQADGRPAISILVHDHDLPEGQAAVVEELVGHLAESIAGLRWLPLVGAPAANQRLSGRGSLVRARKTQGVVYLLSCQPVPGEAILISLCEAASGRVIWSSRHDLNQNGPGGDIKRVAIDAIAAVSSRIEADQAERLQDRPIEDLNPDELLWRARWHKRRLTRADAELTADLLDLAATARPGTVDLIIEQAEAEASRIWATASVPGSFDDLRARVALARDIDPYDARAWLLLGVIDMWQGQHDSAAALMHEAIALNPSFSPAYAQLGTCYILSGEPGDGIRTIHTALRLTPQDNKNFHRFGQLALANIMLENYDEAVNSANSALARRPGYSFGHVYGAAALWMNGDHEEAERAAAKLLSSRPDYDLELLKAIPFKDRIWNDRLYGAMSQLFDRCRSPERATGN